MRLKEDDRKIECVGSIPTIPTTLSIEVIKEIDCRLDLAIKAYDKLGLVLRYQQGLFYWRIRQELPLGEVEAYWKSKHLETRRINEKIKFARVMTRYPILLATTVSYTKFTTHMSFFLKQVELQPLKDLCGISMPSITVGMDTFVLDSRIPDIDIDLKKKVGFLRCVYLN